ncbi:hypothetical protein NDU88_002314 [Pleurodeles waltl]|uniref:Uncharacterized protein n=1 Tax=Pleurodeles waltl TaxID=8319 RepID=A0AAV7SEY3_PLEWA|nr:hypothetical protein NDU88_002314 [Pleurodeles waltl]
MECGCTQHRAPRGCLGDEKCAVRRLTNPGSAPDPGRPALTGGELHPGADLVHGGRVAEEEEDEGDDAGDDEHHREADEEGSGFEGSRRDAGEVGEAASAAELAEQAAADAVVEEAEVACLRGVHAVADPVRLDEAHHVHDGEEDGEDGPQHADGPRVPHVVGVIDLGRLLSGGQGRRTPRHIGGRGGALWLQLGPSRATRARLSPEHRCTYLRASADPSTAPSILSLQPRLARGTNRSASATSSSHWSSCRSHQQQRSASLTRDAACARHQGARAAPRRGRVERGRSRE